MAAIASKEIHADKSDALKMAESKRVRKIASVKKQLAKLEQMKFD